MEYVDNSDDWPEMEEALVNFGISRQTVVRIVGMPHLTKDMVNRWVAYCRLRGRQSNHGTIGFLLIRLNRNDIPAPSWGAIRRLERKLQAGKAPGGQAGANNGNL